MNSETKEVITVIKDELIKIPENKTIMDNPLFVFSILMGSFIFLICLCMIIMYFQTKLEIMRKNAGLGIGSGSESDTTTSKSSNK